jgi:predicted phosphodiesterase
MYGVHDVRVEYGPESKKWELIPIGDIHIGAKGCDLTRLRRLVDWMKERERTLWIGMGDYADCINFHDKRFDPATIDPSFLPYLDNLVPEQFRRLNEILHPIKEKCIGLHAGNHEETIRKWYNYDITQQFSNDWGVPNLGYSAFTRLNFENNSHRERITVWSQHGAAGGRYKGGKINRLQHVMRCFDADVYLYAHTHMKDVFDETVLYAGGTSKQPRVMQRRKVGALTGSFLRGYVEGCTTYVERFDYPPNELGVVKITIILDNRDNRGRRLPADIHGSV